MVNLFFPNLKQSIDKGMQVSAYEIGGGIMAKFSVAFSFSFFLSCTFARFIKCEGIINKGEGKGSVVAVCGDFGSSLAASALCILLWLRDSTREHRQSESEGDAQAR